ncbi:MAG: hypothetical protein LC112_13790 [Flavobacteriales bacterium]|nr:hypothetical protein [Flavobacteriales bacterium]
MQLLNTIPVSIKNILQKWGVFFMYLFVNGLFVIKYGGQFSLYLLPIYIIAIFSISVLYIKSDLKEIIYKYLYWILVAVFFLFSIGLNYYVDGNSLNVDRWDAMEVGIKAIFNNEYPYNIKDFLGRESSNLPFLMILGMPFYFLFGSVGFLQSFSFLLFSYLIFKVFDNYKLRFAGLILLVLSPSYLWEVYVKSDLMSNFILVAGFSFLVWTQFITRKKIKVEWISLMTALILLTRLSVLIPLIILLFKVFYKFSVKEKVRFILVFLFTVSGLLYVFFHNAPNWDVILEHNPFAIQGGKQPLILSVSYIALAIFFAFKAKSFFAVALSSALLLFIAVLTPYLLALAEYGYENIMVESYFDLSFFNMSTPFLIVNLIFILKRNFNINQK